jgi:hypothetical protein
MGHFVCAPRFRLKITTVRVCKELFIPEFGKDGRDTVKNSEDFISGNFGILLT